MWEYDDVYQAIVTFINQELCDTNLTLNFGVIALSTHSNQALVKFKLLNLQTNKSSHWISVLTGETIEELSEEVKILVQLKRAELNNNSNSI